MKTTINLIKVTALLVTTLFTAHAGACEPTGPKVQTNGRTAAATPTAKHAPATTDRYFDPASQTWILTQN